MTRLVRSPEIGDDTARRPTALSFAARARRLARADAVGEVRCLVTDLPLIDRVTAVVAFLLPLAYAPWFFVPSWTPRMAVMLVLLPFGLSRLVRSLHDRDVASFALVALAVVLCVSTVVGEAPLWNLRGGFGRDSSLSFIAVAGSAWACGRAVSSAGRRLVAAGALAGFALSGVAVAVQLVADPEQGLLQMIGDRPSGLLVNPVYYGAVAAGMLAMATCALPNLGRVRNVGFVAIVVLAGLANLSGSRIALATGVGVAVLGLVRAHRPLRLPLALCFGLGWTWSWLAANTLGAQDATGRSGAGLNGRLGIWRYGIRAWWDEPLLGHGLGQFRPAVQGYFDDEFVTEHVSDIGGAAWPDAHNFVVQFAVVGGAAAVVCLAVFGFEATRRARGPAAWAAAAIAVTWLMQPMSLATTPLAAILLGVAWDGDRSTAAGTETSTVRLLVVLGAVFSVALLGLDNRLYRSAEAGDAAAFVHWARVGPSDPVVASTASSLAAGIGFAGEALVWGQLAADLEPRDAVTVSVLAIRQYEAGRCEEARLTWERALEFDPHNHYAQAVRKVLQTPDEESSCTYP